AQSLESGVAELALVGQLAVFDLDSEHRCHPADPARLAANWRVGERGSLLLQLLELRTKLRERILAKARSDLAAIHQPAVIVVAADQQRTEIAARAVRCRESADHQIQAPSALDLEP